MASVCEAEVMNRRLVAWKFILFAGLASTGMIKLSNSFFSYHILKMRLRIRFQDELYSPFGVNIDKRLNYKAGTCLSVDHSVQLINSRLKKVCKKGNWNGQKQ